MNHLGIVVAVPAEARSLARQPVANGGLIYLSDGAVLKVSGMGPKRAAVASRTLLEEGATALLSWGSAGGLCRELSPGSLILPKTVIASDQSLYHVEASWHERLCNRLKGHIDLHTGPLVESTTVVCTPVDKAALFHRTGAIGVDMESAAVATVAQEARLPFMVVRAIADSLDTTIPNYISNALDEFGRWRFSRLFLGLTKHPADLFALVRLGRNYSAAQRTLTAVALLAGNKLFDCRNTVKEGP